MDTLRIKTVGDISPRIIHARHDSSNRSVFNGRVKGVLLSIEEDDGKHVVDPVEAIRMTLARQ